MVQCQRCKRDFYDEDSRAIHYIDEHKRIAIQIISGELRIKDLSEGIKIDISQK